jgi:hypothetical protein
MTSIDVYRLLQAAEELRHLQELADALLDDPRTGAICFHLRCAERALNEADRLAEVISPLAEPMPWWREWQEKHGSHVQDDE